MAVKKFAISVPEEVMTQVDLAARSRGLTRSRFISDVLRKVARARSDAEIRRRVNQLFADPELTAEQKETARSFGDVASATGTEW